MEYVICFHLFDRIGAFLAAQESAGKNGAAQTPRCLLIFSIKHTMCAGTPQGVITTARGATATKKNEKDAVF